LVATQAHSWRTPDLPTVVTDATVTVTLWADTYAVPDAVGQKVDPYQALANGTHGVKALLYQGWLRQSVDLEYQAGTGTVTEAAVRGAKFVGTFTDVDTSLIYADLMVWPSQYGITLDVLQASKDTPSCIAVNQANC
jgi:hypothetical protein